MDDAARPSRFSDLAGAFLAGAARRLPEAVEEKAEIPVARAEERKGDANVDLRRGRSQVSRSGLDGGVDDRSAENGNSLESPTGAVVGAKSASTVSFGVLGRIAQVRISGGDRAAYAKGRSATHPADYLTLLHRRTHAAKKSASTFASLSAGK